MRDIKKNNFLPVVLTIAGSDSGGGAGIQADLRTFSYFGVYGTSAVTAVTAQNPCEVRRIDPLSAVSARTQAEAVFAKFAVRAVKTGMLFNSGIIAAVSDIIESRRKIPEHGHMHLVVDPVMVATSGAVLLRNDAISILKKQLLPLADWITPNIPEAEILSGIEIKDFEDMLKASVLCSEKWGCGCIVKGGHLTDRKKHKTDIVAYGGAVFALESPSAGNNSLHGTGCSFSAAFAACLALGRDWKGALLMAKAYIYGSIKESVLTGKDIRSLYPPKENYDTLVSLREMRS